MTNEPTPETDPIFRDNVPDDAQIAALLFCERLEIQRNAARAERDALRADSRELKALLLLLANAVHDENWKEIGSLVPRMAAVFATPAQ